MRFKKSIAIMLIFNSASSLYGMEKSLSFQPCYKEIGKGLQEIQGVVEEHSLKELEELYKKKTPSKEEVNIVPSFGNTLLYDAVVSANPDESIDSESFEQRRSFVGVLLAKSDFDPSDEKYADIALAAAAQPDSALFKMLVDAGLPIDAKTMDEKTCLIKAVQAINPYALRKQPERRKKELNERLRMVQLILEKPEGKELINCQTTSDRTALFEVSEKRLALTPIIDQLMEAGADPYIADPDGQNAFDVQFFPIMRQHMQRKWEEYKQLQPKSDLDEATEALVNMEVKEKDGQDK